MLYVSLETPTPIMKDLLSLILSFQLLVGCGFCGFEMVSLSSSGWPRSLYVNQAGIFFPLFPVPPCSAGYVFRYSLVS